MKPTQQQWAERDQFTRVRVATELWEVNSNIFDTTVRIEDVIDFAFYSIPGGLMSLGSIHKLWLLRPVREWLQFHNVECFLGVLTEAEPSQTYYHNGIYNAPGVYGLGVFLWFHNPDDAMTFKLTFGD